MPDDAEGHQHLAQGAGSNVSLRIYDMKGKLIRTLVDGFEPSGTQSVTWFGRNDQGRPGD